MEKDFKNEVLAVFKPQTIDIRAIAKSCQGLKINGIKDEEGYKKVFDALQVLKKARTNLTKFAKSLRDEYTAKNREIKVIEEDYLGIITPIEDDLKAQREAIDKEKSRQERMILLPGRKKLFEEIGLTLVTDEFILSMDEKEFSSYYNEQKLVYLEAKEKQQKEEEERKEQVARIEKEKEEAVKNATHVAQEKAELARIKAAQLAKEALEKAEKEKQESIDKIKREHEEVEKNRVAEEERKELEAKKDKEKAEKNKKYQEWVVSIGIDTSIGDKIERIGDTFVAYKKVGEIIIK